MYKRNFIWCFLKKLNKDLPLKGATQRCIIVVRKLAPERFIPTKPWQINLEPQMSHRQTIVLQLF